MNTNTQDTMRDRVRLARPVAPEDLQRGQYVTMLTYTQELVPDMLFGGSFDAPRVHRVERLPGHALPMRIIDVCLPFVLIKDVEGDTLVLDTRRVRLARITKRFAREAFRRMKPNKRKKKDDDDDDDDD